MPTSVMRSIAAAFASLRDLPSCAGRLGDLVADAHDRVQRRQGVLEDHADRVALSRRAAAERDPVTVLAVDEHLSGDDPGRTRQEPEHARSVRLLPEPDSPTSPTDSPTPTRATTRGPRAPPVRHRDVHVQVADL